MDYHAVGIKEVMKEFGSNVNGLDESEISGLLGKHGKNILRKTRHFNALKVLFSQFQSFLIIVLIFAAVLSFFMESIVDSIIIFAIITIIKKD